VRPMPFFCFLADVEHKSFFLNKVSLLDGINDDNDDSLRRLAHHIRKS